IPVSPHQFAPVPALEEVKPACIVLGKLFYPAFLAAVRVNLEISGRPCLSLFYPLPPLPMGKIAVKVQMYFLLPQFSNSMWMQPDRPSGHNSMNLAVFL